MLICRYDRGQAQIIIRQTSLVNSINEGFNIQVLKCPGNNNFTYVGRFIKCQVEGYGFITSTNIVQDLPFGEKSLKLSSSAVIKVPNVIRSIIPEHIIEQYKGYCRESGFTPMSRSTLCRILNVCSATVRKSLQGIDYVAAEGANAFDDLQDVVEKLGDIHGKGHTWAKDQNEKHKNAKRYLKTDYKVLFSYK